MRNRDDGLFDMNVWRPALENYGAVTQLTVALYDRLGRLICHPFPPNPLFELFNRHGHEPEILRECAGQCLRPAPDRPPVSVCQSYGLAAVGASLMLEGAIVGAAVAGYAMVDFCRASAVESLAHQAGIPFRELWRVAIALQPLSERRLIVHGQLLKVLGDAILREHHRTLQLEELAAELERRVRRRTSELAAANQSLGVQVNERTEAEAHVRKLLSRLVVVQEDERHRIARDIHDHLGQQMTALKLRLELLKLRGAGSTEWETELDYARTLVSRLDADVELLTAGLHPDFVEGLGLVPALGSFLDDWSASFGLAARFHGPGLLPSQLNAEAEIHLFRIAQEALNNIHKHAHATRVDVRLAVRDETLLLRIEDDGDGFDPEGASERQPRGGLGLVGMRERAALMRGTLAIETMPGRGTAVIVTVPMH